MSNKKTRYFVAISGAILAIGLGTGLVASYMGLPVSVFTSAAGPDELQYVPADAAVVAYANVRDVMDSQFRQRFKSIEPSQQEQNEFEEKTGLNFEQDVDSVVAAVMPKDNLAEQPGRSRSSFSRAAVSRPRASRPSRSSTARRSPTTRASASSPLTTTNADGIQARRHGRSASSKPTWSPSAALNTVKASIDAHATNRNVVSNNEMMKLVNEIDNANAWAVGRFDAIATKAGIPNEIAAQMPAISWFSAAGHVNGGVSGTLQGRNQGRSHGAEPARRACRASSPWPRCRRATSPACSSWPIR